MANLENIINRKTESDAQWKEERQAERENTAAMRDAGITEITSNPEVYAKYLEIQGDNPTYSPGNVALVMFQLDGATTFGTIDRWKSLNRKVLDTERGKGAKIFARAAYPNRGYSLTDAFDIKQTQGTALKKTLLQDDTPQMETALATLLNYSIVPVVTDGELDCPALYDPQEMELHINPACEDSEAFASIASEIAQVRFHAKGATAGYDYEESRLDAESVSYILCRQFGIERAMPDISRVAELYEGWDTDSRSEMLRRVHEMTKQIGGSIERGITPQQRGRLPEKRPAR